MEKPISREYEIKAIDTANLQALVDELYERSDTRVFELMSKIMEVDSELE